MDINNNVIRNRFPNLIPIIKDIDSIPDKYNVMCSRDNRLNLTLNMNGRIHYIYSQYNSEREVNIWVENVSETVRSSQYVLIIGLGLGYHLEALIQKHPDKRFYIYEPDAYLFSLAVYSYDLSKLLNHQSIAGLAVGSSEHVNLKFLDAFTEEISGSFAELTIPSYEKLYESEIKSFNELAIQVTKMKRCNLATYSVFAQDWIRNIFRNMKYIVKSPSASFLHNKFHGMPAVIVGSGPSLRYDLEVLKNIKNKVLIIAAGTSTQALIAAGIEPDIIVSMDGGVSNYRAFQSIDTEHIPMVYGAFIHPDILSDTRKYISYTIMDSDVVTPHLIGNTENNMIEFKSNFSVTGLCIQLAVYMGCTTVVLTGQDLSFPNQQYYVSGVNHSDPEVITSITNAATMEVGNVYGTMNCTNNIMLVTLRDIESLIQLYPNVHFINASQHGADIKGAPFSPLEGLRYNQLETKTANKMKDLFELEKKTNIRTSVIHQMQRDLNDLSKLKRDLSQLLKLIHHLKNKINNRKELVVGLHKISDIWSKISNNKTYRVYVIFGLSSIMNSYQRYISEISVQVNLKQKFTIIETHLVALSELIIQFIPFVETTINDSLRQLQADN